MNLHHQATASEWPAQSLAFIDYWESLRTGEALVPSFQAFIDSSAGAFIASVYIGEMTAEGAMVLFQGTELERRFGRDLTGLEIHAGRSEQMKRRSLANLKHVLERPCGILSRLVFATTKQRLTSAVTVQLPLAPKPGRPPRIVCHSLADTMSAFEPADAGYFTTERLMWIDIGAGVPAEQPYPLTDGK